MSVLVPAWAAAPTGRHCRPCLLSEDEIVYFDAVSIILWNWRELTRVRVPRRSLGGRAVVCCQRRRRRVFCSERRSIWCWDPDAERVVLEAPDGDGAATDDDPLAMAAGDAGHVVTVMASGRLLVRRQEDLALVASERVVDGYNPLVSADVCFFAHSRTFVVLVNAEEAQFWVVCDDYGRGVKRVRRHTSLSIHGKLTGVAASSLAYVTVDRGTLLVLDGAGTLLKSLQHDSGASLTSVASAGSTIFLGHGAGDGTVEELVEGTLARRHVHPCFREMARSSSQRRSRKKSGAVSAVVSIDALDDQRFVTAFRDGTIAVSVNGVLRAVSLAHFGHVGAIASSMTAHDTTLLVALAADDQTVGLHALCGPLEKNVFVDLPRSVDAHLSAWSRDRSTPRDAVGGRVLPTSLCFLGRRLRLAVGDVDGVIRVFDVSANPAELLATVRLPERMPIASMSFARGLLTAQQRHALAFVRVDDGRRRAGVVAVSPQVSGAFLTSCHMLSTGKACVAATRQEILWLDVDRKPSKNRCDEEAVTTACLTVVAVLPDDALALAVHPSELYAFVLCGSWTVLVYELPDGVSCGGFTLDGPDPFVSLSMDRSGLYMAAATRYAVSLVEAGTGKLVAHSPRLRRGQSAGVCFSPFGDRIVFGASAWEVPQSARRNMGAVFERMLHMSTPDRGRAFWKAFPLRFAEPPLLTGAPPQLSASERARRLDAHRQAELDRVREQERFEEMQREYVPQTADQRREQLSLDAPDARKAAKRAVAAIVDRAVAFVWCRELVLDLIARVQ